MKTMYRAFVMNHEGYSYPELLTQTEEIGDKYEREWNERQLLDYEEDGYTLVNSVITTERDIYLKFLLKYRLGDLRHTSKTYDEYIEDLKKKGASKQVINETIRLQADYIDTLMKKVASVVSRCMRYDVEVDDELAISCYNWRQAQLR